MSPTEPIDTIRHVATPEGCQISLRIAGPVTRGRAWLFDFLLRAGAWAIVWTIAAFSGAFGAGLALATGFAIEWLYPIVFEVAWRGQTPGKRACGLVVLHQDGRPVGWAASFVRNTLRIVDFLPMFYATGVVSTLLDADCRRLGDLAAGTVVAYVEQRPAPTAPSHDEERGAEPPPIALAPEEQQALIEFRRRAAQLTRERAEELALLPRPLTAGLAPAEARARLLRIANYLLGQR